MCRVAWGALVALGLASAAAAQDFDGAPWMRAEPRWADGTPLAVDPRRALEAAVQRLARRGLALRCGLEVEFHVYRIEGAGAGDDPAEAHWPGEPPRVSLLHPDRKSVV